jgi:hypothetical protein
MDKVIGMSKHVFNAVYSHVPHASNNWSSFGWVVAWFSPDLPNKTRINTCAWPRMIQWYGHICLPWWIYYAQNK